MPTLALSHTVVDDCNGFSLLAKGSMFRPKGPSAPRLRPSPRTLGVVSQTVVEEPAGMNGLHWQAQIRARKKIASLEKNILLFDKAHEFGCDGLHTCNV